MGVDLGNLFKKEKISFNDLHDRVIVIDAHNVLHQFLSIIRQRDGTPLRDSKGQITSHLSGLFYRTANIIEVHTGLALISIVGVIGIVSRPRSMIPDANRDIPSQLL